MGIRVIDSVPRFAPARCTQGLAGATCVAVMAIASAGPSLAAQSELLLDPAATVGNELGFALDQDAGFVATGSPGDAGGRGAVHLFDCTATPCTPPVRLEGAGGAEGDHFGAALALDGDTLVVAAPGRTPASVYVFARTGGNWSQQARIDSPGGAAAAGFAGAVALSSDRLAIGAEGADDNAGAVYVFLRDGSAWSQEARLVVVDAAAGSRFGKAVAMDGGMLVAGAPFEAGSAEGAFARGAIHAFARSGTTWSPLPRLTAQDAADGDLLGLSIALDEGRILAGAPLADLRAGAAVLFEESGGSWTQRARLSAPGGLPGDRFGWSVSFAGAGALLVGAPYALEGCGTATVFRSSGVSWQPTSEAVADLPLPSVMLGWSVSAEGGRIAVAAPGHAGAPEHRGAVHLFGGGDGVFRDGFEPSVAAIACEEK